MAGGTDDHGLPYAPERLPAKPEVGRGGFVAVDLRVGRVTGAAAFPEARNPSWQLTVDFGPVIGQLRTSARVTNYAENELLGRLVVGVVNLGTRRIAGFDSQFLVLGALDADGTVRLLDVPHDVEPGSIVA